MRIISYIEFKNIKKKYKNSSKHVLDNFNLSIEKGELIVIVGPSGSGKSTILEIICGFEKATEGEIYIDKKLVNNIEPKDRDVAMVFQNYALYPHLTVYENIAFGMKIRKVNKNDIDSKVKWAANILELDKELHKKPKELSGGQRQRVALARAIVRDPKVFLMDEPLSNLDAKLKYSTCKEISRLHKKLNATIIYVTHDQAEALTIADKIVVLDQGEIMQIGNPRDVYEYPNNIFVAKFLGRPEINLFDIEVEEEFIVLEKLLKIKKENIFNNLKFGEEYILGIRPENIELDENGFEVRVDKIQYLGGELILELNYKNIIFNMKTYSKYDFKEDTNIKVNFNFNNVNIFNKKTKENIKRRDTYEKKID